ncbi:MAG: hypothetical protein WC799_18145 [Desulfobacteraceae bacterium]|jgi:uncharacterized protein (DUF1778 family)
MDKDWNDFKNMYGNIEGARSAFEKACETLFREVYSEDVQQVEVKQGDGGIDIYVGDIGVEPIIVIQCKFFLDNFGDTQHNQIRASFKKAIESEKYELKEWILCIPKILDIDQNLWWSNWKRKTIAHHSKPIDFIKLKTGNALIDLMKKYDVYNDIFKIEDSKKIDDIYKYIINPPTVNSVKKQRITDNKDSSYKKSLLKIAYSLSKDISLCNLTNKQIFDTLVLSIIYHQSLINRTIDSIDALKVLISELIKIQTGNEKIEASLKRLQKAKKIKSTDTPIELSTECFSQFRDSSTNQEDDIVLLKKYIVSNIKNTLEKDLSENDIINIETNSYESIIAFIKLYAYEVLVEDANISSEKARAVIIEHAKLKLPQEIADSLILVLGRVLSSPDEKIEKILNNIRKVYLGLQFFGLDPEIRKKQSKSFYGKNYILDTDFVLNLIVKHAQKSLLYRRIVKFLIESGAKVIIPREILFEVAEHAKYAKRSYNYFQISESSLDFDLLIEKIGNVFVEGYFIMHRYSNEISFDDYLENYYDKKDSAAFLEDLVHDEINSNIQFNYLSDFKQFDRNTNLRNEFKETILSYTLNTHKAGYRDIDENNRIASCDADMYLTFYEENAHKGDTQYSVITTSTRALKVANELNIFKKFYIHPSTLVTFLEATYPFDFNYQDISVIFDNPFLRHSINENWQIIKKVIDFGGNLKGKELTRLKRDIDELSQKKLYNFENTEISESDIDLVNELKQRNYTFSGELNNLVDEMNATKERNKKLEEALEQHKQKEEKNKQKNAAKKRYNKKVKSNKNKK